ncbi:Notoamide biosynthesis cluster transcriptional coactivator [Fulvia fulva]|uniref:Notoamide biosynthesis cluster transcriptional coactivator n=1 Tax=Passalora fulva TaxID=5499 RepID=A0A9Q8PCV2_PASFU|nr:Notoamide biosynthesis cluster transcriptional coactivator [Fulvia fulva]KAK4620544.1 hypothetical protein CLAFUR0_11674 [Fulvia fulva]UJO20219.1 Notoamide biosynthesis cluster transcriptional coactivator [Fulvia fulva]WPV32634.1 hypothetical protein CLAFUW7_11664 [Fulvia fulva]
MAKRLRLRLWLDQQARPPTFMDELSDGLLQGEQSSPARVPKVMDRQSDETLVLSRSMMSDLCSIWFEKYHRWFPILHQPTFDQIIDQPNVVVPSDRRMVIDAIAVATMEHYEVLSVDPAQRQQLQDNIAASVLRRAIATASLASVQALLILSALSYGHGKLMEAWNMLAICRRIALHLSSDIMTDQSTPTATTPTALRRLPTHTNLVVTDEGKIRAFWMTRMLENISVIGARYEAGSTTVPGDPLLPCSDSFWTSPNMVMGEGQVRPFGYYCSAFSLSIILAVSELSYVHQFLRKPVNMACFAERDTWQSEAQQIDERLTAWRDEFVAAFFRLANAEHAHHERAEMDAYIVLTDCVLNTAVITLLHRRSPCPAGIDQVVEPWAFASSRFVYASENTAFKIRQMHEDELVNCHPHSPFSIFVAARFYIVHSKALDANVPTNLHSLAFALHTCGKHWALARLFERIIRIAVAEYRTPIAASTVPREFYDLRLTTFEIAESLIEWAQGPGTHAAANIGSTQSHATATFMRMAVDVLA